MKQSYPSLSGSTLVAAVLFLAIISGATGIALLATSSLGRNALRTRQHEGAIAAGDAHLEWAFAQWRATCRAQSNVQFPTAKFDEVLTLPDSAWLPQPSGYSVSNFRVMAVDMQGNPVGTNEPPTAAQGQSSTNNSYFYEASVDVKVPALGGKPIAVNLRRVFEKRVESPWEYAIFYNDELEIHPSPKFTVTGWVHTNGHLYASPDGGQPLIFNDRVTYSKGYTMGYMDGNWQSRGLPGPQGKAPGNSFATDLPASLEARKDFFGISPSQFSATDTDKNNDSYRELIEMPEPGLDSLADGSGENPRIVNAASVVVTVDNDNKIVVKNAAGKVMSPTSAIREEKDFYNTVAGALTTNQPIQDFREAGSVRLVTLDISKLNPKTIDGWNGVVYISDRSANLPSAPKRGIRLRNGSTLPAGGLTVASDNPVYIQGDYNTVGKRQPAAVMGDAIMILSNNWRDANSSADINSKTGLRNATDTTINTAILGGIVTTDKNVTGRTAYSGGVENFPRFMENWSGKTLKYSGSMVQLFESKQAVGRWGNSTQSYNPPIRDWAYETLFRTSPPPGTLFITTYSKQRWYLK